MKFGINEKIFLIYGHYNDKSFNIVIDTVDVVDLYKDLIQCLQVRSQIKLY